MVCAADVASMSTEQHRHGAIIARRGVRLSSGFNKNKTHPAARNYRSWCVHAELAAILATKGASLNGASIFVTRIMRYKQQSLGISKPCDECMKLIKFNGIKNVYYTNYEGSWVVQKI
jgi:deoxycytidylate deaminase